MKLKQIPWPNEEARIEINKKQTVFHCSFSFCPSSAKSAAFSLFSVFMHFSVFIFFSAFAPTLRNLPTDSALPPIPPCSSSHSPLFVRRSSSPSAGTRFNKRRWEHCLFFVLFLCSCFFCLHQILLSILSFEEDPFKWVIHWGQFSSKFGLCFLFFSS